MQAVNRKKPQEHSITFSWHAKTDLVRLGVICSSNESHRNARFVSLRMYKRLRSSTNTTLIGEIVVGAGRNLTRDNLVCAISTIPRAQLRLKLYYCISSETLQFVRISGIQNEYSNSLSKEHLYTLISWLPSYSAIHGIEVNFHIRPDEKLSFQRNCMCFRVSRELKQEMLISNKLIRIKFPP